MRRKGRKFYFLNNKKKTKTNRHGQDEENKTGCPRTRGYGREQLNGIAKVYTEGKTGNVSRNAYKKKKKKRERVRRGCVGVNASRQVHFTQ